MNTRQEQLLKLVVESYIERAEPVGSNFLVENTDLGVSGATIRNEMRELEEQGYLTHPHTSSGRIPTELGYRHYVENLMGSVSIEDNHKQEIQVCFSGAEGERAVKNIAKYIAEKTNNAVIVAFGTDALYYTGMSQLFTQPEFRDYAYMIKTSTIFDQCEERIEDIIDLFIDKEPKVLIGTDNPFGQMTSMVGVRIGEVFFTILGPMRMDYGKAYSFVNYLKSTTQDSQNTTQ
jgi:transcriptional regulator of heat shock response